MNAPRLLFPVMMGVLLAAAVSAEAWMLRQARLRAARSLSALEQKKQERDRLEKLSPAPTAENEAAILTAVTEARETLVRLREGLAAEIDPRGDPVPARPVDSLFALTEFAENMRRKAVEAQVALKPQESFGFASHANEGPSAEAIPLVHRQQRAVQELLDAVLAVRPQALLAVNRERPPAQEEDGGPAGRVDFFTPSPTLLVRQPGLVETDVFRLEFTGQTGVLRDFLAVWAISPWPVLVRSVEVEPLNRAVGTPAVFFADKSVVVATATPSRFVVTVEVPVPIIPAGGQP